MKKRGKKIREIASAGSMTKVNKAITAAGSPRPRNPLTIPETKKVIIINMIIRGSEEGNKAIKRLSIFAFPITSYNGCK